MTARLLVTIVYWMPVLAYAALIFILSSMPNPHRLAPGFLDQLNDKLIHTIEYSVMGVLCYRGWRYGAGAPAGRYAVVFSIVTAILYGITDEIHQAFVPLRESSVADVIADGLGATLGAVFWNRLTDTPKAGVSPVESAGL